MPDVELRHLAASDLPAIARWLAEPEVYRWWHDDPAGVEGEYGGVVAGTDPTHVLIASTGGEDFGLVQWYLFAEERQYVEELASAGVEVPAGSGSLDYLIGEERFRGRGLASAMLLGALGQMVDAGVTSAVVPVHAGNVRSWRLLERCGFVRVASAELDPDNPADTRDHVVYRLDLAGRRTRVSVAPPGPPRPGGAAPTR